MKRIIIILSVLLCVTMQAQTCKKKIVTLEDRVITMAEEVNKAWKKIGQMNNKIIKYERQILKKRNNYDADEDDDFDDED